MLTRTFNHFYDIGTKRGTMLEAAHVFDGVMMSPLDAQEYAKQLNDDFYNINKQYSVLNNFVYELERAGFSWKRNPKIVMEVKAAIAQINSDRLRFFARLKKEHVKQFPYPE